MSENDPASQILIEAGLTPQTAASRQPQRQAGTMPVNNGYKRTPAPPLSASERQRVARKRALIDSELAKPIVGAVIKEHGQ